MQNTSNNGEMIIVNTILTTALLSNEICIQTKGEYVLSETDYISIVKNFQYTLSKKIVPIRTQDELKAEAKKYIGELLASLIKGDENDNNDSDSSITNTASAGVGNGENSGIEG